MFVKQHEIFIIYIYYIYDVITIVKLNEKTTHTLQNEIMLIVESKMENKRKQEGDDDNYDKIWNRKL